MTTGPALHQPVAMSVIAALAIFTFLLSWKTSTVRHRDEHGGKIPVGVVTVQSTYGVPHADTMASAVLGALPLIVVFLVFQRQIVQGFANTSLKSWRA